MSLPPRGCVQTLQMALHAEFRFGVRLFREPDAGNPPVRFDEREEETELSQTGLRRRGESSATCHREATVTAPLPGSTHLPSGNLISAGLSLRQFVLVAMSLPSLQLNESNFAASMLRRR